MDSIDYKTDLRDTPERMGELEIADQLTNEKRKMYITESSNL